MTTAAAGPAIAGPPTPMPPTACSRPSANWPPTGRPAGTAGGPDQHGAVAAVMRRRQDSLATTLGSKMDDAGDDPAHIDFSEGIDTCLAFHRARDWHHHPGGQSECR